MVSFFFFFNDTATTEIYTLSLHDALPICGEERQSRGRARTGALGACGSERAQIAAADRKSTRLNSSHSQISYAVFCLKKKKNIYTSTSHHTSTTACPDNPNAHLTHSGASA